MKLSELKNWAREEGIANFSKMSKADLQELFDESQPERPRKKGIIDWKKKKKKKATPAQNLLDQPNLIINVPILKPITKKLVPEKVSRIARKTVETFSDWLDWLKDTSAWEGADALFQKVKKNVNPKLQKLKEKIKTLWKKPEEFQMQEGPSALSEFVREYIIMGKIGFSPDQFLERVKPKVLPLFEDRLRVKMVLTCQMSRTDLRTGEIITQWADFHSRIETILEGTNTEEVYEEMRARIIENLENFQRLGSNWRFDFVARLSIHTVRFRPLRGNSFLKLPKSLKNKKAIINVKNNDEECFKWAVGRSIFPSIVHPERITTELRKQVKKFNWKGISFPTPITQISKFERQNEVMQSMYLASMELFIP